MAVITWPAALPQKFPVDTDLQQGDGRVRWDPDAGPSRIRRVSTAQPDVYRPPPFRMSASQVELLRTFVDETLAGGVLPFDWLAPWHGAGLVRFWLLALPVVRFVSGPLPVQPDEIVPGSSNPQRLARVTLELEARPWEPAELETPSATLTSLVGLFVSGGYDVAATGIQAGDFARFKDDPEGAATEIDLVAGSVIGLSSDYPIGPVSRTGELVLVKVYRA